MSLLGPSRPCWLRRDGHYFHGYNQVVRGRGQAGVRVVDGGLSHSTQLLLSWSLQPLLPGGSCIRITSLSFRDANIFCLSDFLYFLQSELHSKYLTALRDLYQISYFTLPPPKKNQKHLIEWHCQMLFFCLNFVLFPWCFMVLVYMNNVINLVVGFHFITVRWGKKEKAQGLEGVGFRGHWQFLKDWGPGFLTVWFTQWPV